MADHKLIIATDGWGDTALWRYRGDNDQHPEAILYKYKVDAVVWSLIEGGLNAVRHHGFSYKHAYEVKVGEFIVTKTKPMGEATHILMVDDAKRVRSIQPRAGNGIRYNFPDYTMGGFYDAEATSMVPVVDGMWGE